MRVPCANVACPMPTRTCTSHVHLLRLTSHVLHVHMLRATTHVLHVHMFRATAHVSCTSWSIARPIAHTCAHEPMLRVSCENMFHVHTCTCCVHTHVACNNIFCEHMLPWTRAHAAYNNTRCVHMSPWKFFNTSACCVCRLPSKLAYVTCNNTFRAHVALKNAPTQSY
jgi:hypothetical protein